MLLYELPNDIPIAVLLGEELGSLASLEAGVALIVSIFVWWKVDRFAVSSSVVVGLELVLLGRLSTYWVLRRY